MEIDNFFKPVFMRQNCLPAPAVLAFTKDSNSAAHQKLLFCHIPRRMHTHASRFLSIRRRKLKLRNDTETNPNFVMFYDTIRETYIFFHNSGDNVSFICPQGDHYDDQPRFTCGRVPKSVRVRQCVNYLRFFHAEYGRSR